MGTRCKPHKWKLDKFLGENTMYYGDTMTLMYILDQTKWIELSRSNN